MYDTFAGRDAVAHWGEPVAIQALTASWAKELQQRLNASPVFAGAAAGWSGSLIFSMRWDTPAGPAERAILLALDEGHCRLARPARPGDRGDCHFILSAPSETWRRILQGDGDPVMAILFGQIRFEMGRWSDLVPYAAAARELLRVAASIEAVFPPS